MDLFHWAYMRSAYQLFVSKNDLRISVSRNIQPLNTPAYRYNLSWRYASSQWIFSASPRMSWYFLGSHMSVTKEEERSVSCLEAHPINAEACRVSRLENLSATVLIIMVWIGVKDKNNIIPLSVLESMILFVAVKNFGLFFLVAFIFACLIYFMAVRIFRWTNGILRAKFHISSIHTLRRLGTNWPVTKNMTYGALRYFSLGLPHHPSYKFLSNKTTCISKTNALCMFTEREWKLNWSSRCGELEQVIVLSWGSNIVACSSFIAKVNSRI